jgi:hypothetical protein
LDFIALENPQSLPNVLLEDMVKLQNFNPVISVLFVLLEGIARME